MYLEMIILAVIIFALFCYGGRINPNKFIADNQVYFRKLKEEDYDFLVKMRYGEGADPDVLFNSRIRNAVVAFFAILVFFITDLSYVNIIIALIVAVVMFKMGYSNLKSYYKRHLHQIDILLPYYLKGLEILIQHYTVPVALAKSVDDAPEIFRDGLRELVNKINAGDPTIQPYMDFAKEYPVRDSMRMMRLLYRLSLGRQERKQEQLVMFSQSISSLQQKARETKYKQRLDKMESKTMMMLVTTGIGTMLLIVVAVMMMMSL